MGMQQVLRAMSSNVHKKWSEVMYCNITSWHLIPSFMLAPPEADKLTIRNHLPGCPLFGMTLNWYKESVGEGQERSQLPCQGRPLLWKVEGLFCLAELSPREGWRPTIKPSDIALDDISNTILVWVIGQLSLKFSGVQGAHSWDGRGPCIAWKRKNLGMSREEKLQQTKTI